MDYVLILLFFLNFLEILNENCSTFDNEYICKSDKIAFDEEMDENAFQTPPRNDIYGRYKSTYQDMHYLVGYSQLKYSLDRKNCTIKIITRVNPKLGKKGENYYFIYKFGDIETRADNITLYAENNTYQNGLPISAKIIDIETQREIVKLELEEEYFLWDNPIVNQSEKYEKGLKGSIVELFGWPYEDIAEECEFLNHAGYMGVKIYSPNEHILTYDIVENGVLNPWYYITQTVSYKLHSRLGDKKQLKKMINICRKNNIRIYAGVVINHMTGGGNDMYDDHKSGNSFYCTHWGPKSGSAGSPFWTITHRYENNKYTGKRPVLEYPSIPYFPSDFHCKKEIKNWNNIDELVNGWLSGMADVNTEKEYVQQRIADFFTELISIGMSGLSISNGKQILPLSIAKIFKKVKENFGGSLPEDFLGVIQIQFGGQLDLVMCNDNSILSYGKPFTEKLIELGFTSQEINQIKIWNTDFLNGESPYCENDEEWKVNPQRVAISIEYTDDINLANNYNIYIRDKNIELHRNLTIKMFNNNYNFKIRNVFSMFSLYYGSNGYPDGKSDCSMCNSEICKKHCTRTFPYRKAYNPISIGYDNGDIYNWVEGEYTRVHRDLSIINAMRTWMGLNNMTDYELYNNERLKAKCNEKCLVCNEESKKEDLCLICNNTKGFYPVIYPKLKQKYFDCYNKSLKYEGVYFDEKEKNFKPCYETCKMCDKEGTPLNHNCKACDNNLIPRPIDTNSLNCVTNCTYNFFFTSSGQYKCTDIKFCPKEASLFIEKKNKCINDCKNDTDFKFLYNGICLNSCPESTFDNNYICQEKNYNVCTISERKIEIKNFYKEKLLDSIVKSYINEYKYSNSHILKLVNIQYNIFIFKNFNCTNFYSLELTTIDFDICYNKVKTYYNINEDLIIIYFKILDLYKPLDGYLLYNPISGVKLKFKNICKEIETTKIGDITIIKLKNENKTDIEIMKYNKDIGLYPIIYPGQKEIYNKYYNKSLIYNGIYFDKENEVFRPCYESCKICDREGNIENHNCLVCESNYMPKPGSITKLFNCVINCTYFFYFSDFGQFKCTDSPYCPIEANKFIKDKNKCINDCKKDNTYKYLYNGICLEKCPENTFNDNFLCKEINYKKCTVSQKDVRIKNYKEEGGINAIIKSYIDEFFYTSKHISLFKNNKFNIIIYKDKSCFDELIKENNENNSLKKINIFSGLSAIDFGNCYDKVKNYYNIEDKLIIAIMENFELINPFSSYSFYNPITGEKLDAQNICKDENIVIKENIKFLLEYNNSKYNSLLYLIGQNINVFDINDAFYTDICFHYDSPNKKDITLKDRILSFFPNISLCDPGCEKKGINLTTMNAICECKFNDIINNELLNNAIFSETFGETIELINNSNIEVLKCFKYIFKYFKKSIGGLIIIIGIGLYIPFTIIFILIDLKKIKAYTIEKTNNYLNYLLDNSINIDEKKDEIFSKSIIIDIKNNDYKNIIKNNRPKQNNNLMPIIKSYMKPENPDKTKDNLSINKINSSSKEILYNIKSHNSKNNKVKDKEKNLKKENDFKEYLSANLDDLDYDDALKQDARTFCAYFRDSIFEKQIFLNTFFLKEPFRPLSIKLILIIFVIIFYFVINGLFYSEDYISELYHLEKEDSFFSFFPRSINRFVYSSIVSCVISFIIDFFFFEEKKMKGIFIREKDNFANLKLEILKLNQNIKIRYISFIIVVFILSLFFFNYLLCFNYVYPNTQIEWIKSSITLMIIMQILSFVSSFAETLLRYISFLLKSEKIFRLSKLLD